MLFFVDQGKRRTFFKALFAMYLFSSIIIHLVIYGMYKQPKSQFSDEPVWGNCKMASEIENRKRVIMIWFVLSIFVAIFPIFPFKIQNELIPFDGYIIYSGLALLNAVAFGYEYFTVIKMFEGAENENTPWNESNWSRGSDTIWAAIIVSLLVILFIAWTSFFQGQNKLAQLEGKIEQQVKGIEGTLPTLPALRGKKANI